MCWSSRSAEQDVVAGDGSGAGTVRVPPTAGTRSVIAASCRARRPRSVVVEVRVRLAARLGQALGEARVGRKAGAIRRSIGTAVGVGRRAIRRSALAAAPGPTPPVSPTNGIPCRSTASRLIRSAAVFCSATSRT